MEPKNSEYYKGNHEVLPTILSIKTDNKNIEIELPWDVILDDLVHAFYGACVAVGFNADSVAATMYDFGEEYYPKQEMNMD
jgi:hypothetical protein